VTYDRSDPEITQALSRMVAAFGNSPVVSAAPLAQTQTTSHPPANPNNIAVNFAAVVAGTPRLVTVMKKWLGATGKALLTDLWKVRASRSGSDVNGESANLSRWVKVFDIAKKFS